MPIPYSRVQKYSAKSSKLRNSMRNTIKNLAIATIFFNMVSYAFAGQSIKTGDWSYQDINNSGYKFAVAEAKFNKKAWISIIYLPQLECSPHMTVMISPKEGLNTSLYYKDQNYQIKIDGNPKKERSEFITSFAKSATGGKLPRIDFKVFLSPDLIEQIKNGSKLQHFYQGENLGTISLKGSGKAIEKAESTCKGYLKSGGWKKVTFGTINGPEWDEIK